MLSEVLHDLIRSHRHLLHVLLPEFVLPLDEIDHRLHVGFSGTIVGHSQGEAVLSEASGDSLQLEGKGLWVLPDEVALCPGLEDHQHEEDEQGAQIDEQVFC